MRYEMMDLDGRGPAIDSRNPEEVFRQMLGCGDRIEQLAERLKVLELRMRSLLKEPATVYLYAEHYPEAGDICDDLEAVEEAGDDLVPYSGTPAELAEQADRLEQQSWAARGEHAAFLMRCAESIRSFVV